MTAVAEVETQQADRIERVVVWDTGEVLEVHPAASLFPMMSEDELDDLGEDIRRNGLAHPIVIDQHRVLIDGRNRLEACRRAMVAPDFAEVTLEDPVAFILSMNVARRQMSKGATAMAMAQAKSFGPKDLAWGGQAALARELGVSPERLSFALTVATHAPELAGDVRNGSLSLDKAYAAAVQSKRARKSAEDEAHQFREDLARLRKREPDLADRVEDHHLTLAEAWVVADKREREAREYRELTTRQLSDALAFLDPRKRDPLALGAELARHVDARAIPAGLDLSSERLAGCMAVLGALIRALPGKQEP